MKLRSSAPVRLRLGFTLVEVLIVIVIIIALGAVVVPMVRNIRNAAGSSKTVANLRQIQAANALFATDNGGFFLGNAPFGEGSDLWGSKTWFGYMPFVSMLGSSVAGEGDDGNSLPDSWRQNFPETLKSGIDVPGEGDLANRNFTIAMNWSSFTHSQSGVPGSSWWISGKILQSRIKNPDKLIMFYESRNYWGKIDQRLNWKGDDGKWNQGMAFRNKGNTCNVVFADGHVGGLTRKDVEKENTTTKRYFLWDAD